MHSRSGVSRAVGSTRLADTHGFLGEVGEARRSLSNVAAWIDLYQMAQQTHVTVPAAAPLDPERQRLLQALDRPRDLADGLLDVGDEPGRLADRAAGAFPSDPDVRQELLETLAVDARLARLAAALDGLLDSLRKRGEPE